MNNARGIGGVLSLAALLLICHPAAASRIPLVRIGLAPEVQQLSLAGNGAWYLGIVGSHLRPTRIAAGEVWSFRGGARGIEVSDGAGTARAVRTDTLFAFPEDPESGSIKVNGLSYRGQLLIWPVETRLTAANVVDLESYLCAVLPQELGPQPPDRYEALKAQAVAARSYTLAMMGRWRDRGFDLLPTVEDQVYAGLSGERPVCTQAVEETRGVVALGDGSPIRAYYSSTCGGHTAAPDEVWRRPAADYLRGVRDLTSRVDHSFCSSSPWFHWKEEWDGKEFESMLRTSLPRTHPEWSAASCGRLTGISIQERSNSQRVSKLRLQFQKGTVDLSGDEIRWVLRRPKNSEGLRSALLTEVKCKTRRGVVKSVRIAGQGYGHGVGMCQFGAMGMARAGYSFDQIIRFYYEGAVLRRFY